MNKRTILSALILTSGLTCDAQAGDVPSGNLLLKGGHLTVQLANSSDTSQGLLGAQPIQSGNYDMAQAAEDPFGNLVVQSDGVWAGKDSHLKHGTGSARTMILRATEGEPGSTSELEEDLSIMSRILTKKMQEQGFEDDVATAMGIKIRTVQIANAASAAGFFENLYLDGYGALFMIRVQFPLLPPPEISKNGESDKPKNTTWEQTKRELYGAKRRVNSRETSPWNIHKQPEEYSSKKVAQLKEALMQALRNATNIRNLSADEHVSIAVVGQNSRPSRLSVSFRTVEDGAMDRSALMLGNVALPDPVFGQTTMTLRVKKSDVDALAQGELEFEAFEKRVDVAVY